MGCQVEDGWEKDGRTAYFRLYGRNSAKAVLEIGEQVMAKPLRRRKSQKTLSLKERWFATWVGIDAKTNEHVVVLGEGESCDPWFFWPASYSPASCVDAGGSEARERPVQRLRRPARHGWVCRGDHRATLRCLTCLKHSDAVVRTTWTRRHCSGNARWKRKSSVGTTWSTNKSTQAG